MGKYDVLEYFQKNPNKWLTSKMIYPEMGVSRNSIQSALRKLVKEKFIEGRRKVGTIEQEYVLRSKYERGIYR